MRLDKFVGQESAKKHINLLISAAKNNRQLPHIGLFGPAGCGKTTLAQILGEEVEAECVYINGAAVTTPVIFRNNIAEAIKAKGVNKKYLIIIDEAHALPKHIQNSLLSALEKPAILCTPAPRNIKLGNGKIISKGEIIKERLPENLNFIMCTTDTTALSEALLSRLHKIYLNSYTEEEKCNAIKTQLAQSGFTWSDEDGIKTLARAAKSMRHLVHIIERALDLLVSRNKTILDKLDVASICDILGIDEYGRDKLDTQYIEYVFRNEPISISNIARYLGCREEDVKNSIEPHLIRQEWIIITPRGRKLSNVAKQLFFGIQLDNANVDINNILEALDIIL